MPAVALLASALLAAGCGGGDDGERPESTPLPTGTPTGTQTPAPESTPEESATRTESCGQVAYQPQSDNGAFDIDARGVSCETARAVATAAEGESDSFDAEGFQCTGEPDRTSELPSTRWSCTGGGDAEITFVTS